MSRRQGPPLYGKRYCGNDSKMEVHDLDNEDKNPPGCQIDEITLEQAHKEGYDNCAKCIGGSRR
jgi:hypothetical protein